MKSVLSHCRCLYVFLVIIPSVEVSQMFPGGHGQPPGPPGSQPPGPVGPPGSGGDGWNPLPGIGSNSIGAPGSGLGIGPLGQTMLPSSPLGNLNQGLGMNTLGTIIPSPTQTAQGAGSMMPPSNVSPIGSGSLTPPGDGSQPHFLCPRRPNLGREGRPIMLRANHFQVSNGRKCQPSQPSGL